MLNFLSQYSVSIAVLIFAAYVVHVTYRKGIR